MTVRRLLLALLLSAVVGLFASSFSGVDSFQAGQLGRQEPSPAVVLWHYGEGSTFCSVNVTQVGTLISSASVAVNQARAAWANTPPIGKSVAAEATAARTGVSLYHGTSVESGTALLDNPALDAAAAAARHIDGQPGFYLATDAGDAEYFALRRAPGTILQYDLSDEGVSALREAGATFRDIPGGPPYFAGQEFHVPVSAFDTFNALLESGHIEVSPYGP